MLPGIYLRILKMATLWISGYERYFDMKTRASVRLSITLGDCVIESKPCVRDLGVNIDNILSMEPQQVN